MAEAVGLYGNYAAPAQQGPYAGLGIEAWRRYTSEYVIEERFGRRDRYSDWRGRIAQLDQLYRGDWPVVFPDQSSITEKPLVQNLIKTVLDDVPMVVSEMTPTLRCDPEGDEDSDLERSLIRQAIGNGYWEADHGDRMVQQLAMDLIGTDTCFLLSYTDKTSQYPKHRVLDPRGCLPNWVDWELYDLMFVEKLMLRQAARLWPDLNLDRDPKRTESMEVVHLYAPDAVVKCIYFINKDGRSPASGKGYIVDIKPNPIEMCPVSWARMPTFDRYLRGFLDQLSGIVLTQHEMTRMMKDGLKKAIYPGKIEFDVENPEDEGPEALLHARSPEAYMKPIDPAKVDPSVPMLFQQLEQHGRSMAAYPAAREGVVKQSIASNAFIEGSEGKMISFVKNVQRHIASLRQQQTAIDFALDEKQADFRKPLIFPVGDKRTYKPTADIKGVHRCRMTYGIGSGLSAMNAGVMVKQDLGAQLISLRTAREQTPYILDPEGEELQRDREEMKQLMKQQLLQPQNAGIAAQVMALMARGIDFVKAIETVQADMQAQAQAMQQQQQAPQAGQPQLPGGQPPEQAAGASLAMQKGGMPQQGAGGPAETEAIQPAFSPPPRALISVGRGRAA